MGATPPRPWAESKRKKLKRYAEGDVARWAAAARDACLPGVPTCALLGFAANGSEDENTTGWIRGDDRERAKALERGRYPLKKGDPRTGYGAIGGRPALHELGPFGVEGGKTPTPPATDRSCPWVTLARGPVARKVLGREGVVGADWYGALPDQVVIGVANLRRHLDAIRAKLDPRLRWDEDVKAIDLFAYAMAMMAWSAGSGGAARHVNAYADELASLPRELRLGRFFLLAGEVDDPRSKHRADEYSALRTLQKLCAAILAAAMTGEAWALAWLDDLLGEQRERVYARLVETSTD